MKTKKKKGNLLSTIFLVGLLAVFLVLIVKSFYGMLTNDKSKDDGKRTEVEKLLTKNLDDSYPATEKEVVKVYCRIMKEMYSGECSEDDIQGLFKQMRKLYDEELIKNNSYDKHFEELTKELEDYKKAKKKIVNYAIEESDDIEKGKYKGKEQALVDVTLSIKEKKEWQHVNQQFIMRKDNDGRWKILGWQKTESEVKTDE